MFKNFFLDNAIQDFININLPVFTKVNNKKNINNSNYIINCSYNTNLLCQYTLGYLDKCYLKNKPIMQKSNKNGQIFEFISSDFKSLPFVSKGIDLAILSMTLHHLPYETRGTLLNELLRVAKHVIIIDYCLAERNINFPAVFFMYMYNRVKSKVSYTKYKDFMSSGALEACLYHNNILVKERKQALGGAILLTLLA